MSSGTRQVRYRAPDISCDHCKRAIEAAVGGLEGVEIVAVDVAGKIVDVTLSEGASVSEIRAAIEAAGYPVAEEWELD